jgi:quinol-cytochrome oxidoreductase complex cytochrome b subunit
MANKVLEKIKNDIVESQVWKAIFRHGYDDTPRNRVMMVTANVFLHLHPAKVRRHAVRMRFTWCMGGLTFLMFLVTVVTGVYLMFYYRPVAEYAYADMKYLEFDMPFGMLMRNMHRWAAHAMVVFVWLHMFRVFLTGSYKPPREFNWIVGVLLLVLTFCPGTSSLSGPSPSVPTWRAPRRFWVMKVRSPTSSAPIRSMTPARSCSAAAKSGRIRCSGSTFCTVFSYR